MTFSITHTRAFVGNDLQVSITSTMPETISAVDVALDGSSLEDCSLLPGTVSYVRMFSGVGSAGPQYDHSLDVAATDQDGAVHRSLTRWADQS